MFINYNIIQAMCYYNLTDSKLQILHFYDLGIETKQLKNDVNLILKESRFDEKRR